MKGLEKTLQTKEGKLQVFKESRDMLILLTDNIASDNSNFADISCSLGSLSKRLDIVADTLEKEFYESQEKELKITKQETKC